jgi:hypothetical protein
MVVLLRELLRKERRSSGNQTIIHRQHHDSKMKDVCAAVVRKAAF